MAALKYARAGGKYRRWLERGTALGQTNTSRARPELRDDHVLVHELRVDGPAYEAARQATEHDDDLEAVVRGMLDIGGTVLLCGTSQAVIDSFQAEMGGALNLVTEQIAGARAVGAERDRGTEKGLSYEALSTTRTT